MARDIESILSLEVPLVVVLGELTVPLRNVLDLVPGSIMELAKDADEELTVLVNNQPIGTGVAVKVGENYGVRVTFVGDIKDRIDALGSTRAEEEQVAQDAEALAEAMMAGQL